MNKILIMIAIIIPVVMMAVITYFNDIELSLYVLIILLIVTCLLAFLIFNPFWGLALMILYMPYSEFISIPLIESGQRVLFIIITIGWLLKYFLKNVSVIFDIIKSNKIIMLFIFSMLISSVLAVKPIPSLTMSFQITSYIFMAFIMQDLIADRKKLIIFITVIAFNVGIISLFGVNEYLVTGITNERGGTIRIGSVYGSANQFGKVLAFGIPFLAFLAFNARNFLFKSICLLLLVSSIFSLFLSLSRSYMLVFVLFVIVFMGLSLRKNIMSIKKVIIILLIIVLISFFMSNLILENIMMRVSKNVTEEARYHILLKGIDLFLENPLFGIGWKNFGYVDPYDTTLSLRRGRAGHEIVSNVFVSIGMFGSLTLLFLFYMIMKWLNTATKYQSIQNDKYLFNFIILLQAGYIAFLFSALGTGVIFGIEFWLYYALSVLLYRWRLRDMAYTARSSINKIS